MAKNKNQKISNKKKYKINNWAEYNEALKQRGSIEIWVNSDFLNKWSALLSGKPGAQPIYPDQAIQIVIQLGKVFHQKLCQAKGLLENIFKLMSIELSVLDSTGLKVYGEGEWKVRQHGVSKRRTWHKAHLGVTPDGEIRMALLTENDVSLQNYFRRQA